MKFIRIIVNRHFKLILSLMILAGIAFVALLPNATSNSGLFIAVWGGALILLALNLGYSNQTLQGKSHSAPATQNDDSLQTLKDALNTTMDPSVAQLIIAGKLRTENRPISVQFTDLKDFTSYAEEKPAEVVLSELNTYLKVMESILQEYKAHIDKYIGDGIMSEFGAPNTYIKHYLLALASGWKMQQSMAGNNFPWQLRVGIATGVSTIGLIGTRRQSYTAFGDTVNLASRLEGLCEPGRVTVDETTYQKCKDYFEFKQKTYLEQTLLENETLYENICIARDEHEKNPGDPDLVLKLAGLLTEAHDTQEALDYLDKAMAQAPDNDQIKLFYAETSITYNKQIKVELRGRKKPIKVYELIGLKNPLGDFKNIPEQFYNQEKETIDSLIPFPEDLTLPVECLDGSIGQSRLVGIVSYLLAVKMQLPDSDKKDILEAGYLADIGKSLVPESVLNRPGQLTDEETTHIHLHPAESVRKLLDLGYDNQNMINIITCHHESCNGKGYPEGLSDGDIPLGSRILAVAEAYVSMTSNRPYRDAWEVKPAYLEIVKYAERGKFDGDVTKALGEIVNEL